MKTNPPALAIISFILTMACFSLMNYTAIDKLFYHQRFQDGISQVELIGRYAIYLSWAVPAMEILTAVLLMIPSIAKLGLGIFIALMAAFTIYITITLIWAPRLPCHCGGIIETLSWKAHLYFNCGFILLATVALKIENYLKH